MILLRGELAASSGLMSYRRALRQQPKALLWHAARQGGRHGADGRHDAAGARGEAERLSGSEGPDPPFVDKLAFSFAEAGARACRLAGCSRSQVASHKDFSTNYCNLHDLFCSSVDGCPAVYFELAYNETAVSTSAGASAVKADCVDRAPPLDPTPAPARW